MNHKNFLNKTAVIVIHEAGVGPGNDLRDYLLDRKIKKLLFISHPLLYAKHAYKNSSRFELYENGLLVREGKAFHWQMPEPFLYIKDVFYSLFWSIRFIGKIDMFFGLGNLNAFAGLLARKIGVTKYVIFYVIDYVPTRFENPVMNFIYHFVDKIAARYSSWTWNLSPRMIEGREKKWRKKFPHQLVVPHGVHINRIKRVGLEKINKTEILYMGSLYEKQGIQLLIEALPMIIKIIPNVKVTIIGRGPYEGEIRKLIVRQKVEKYVDLLGYIESHEEMENIIAKAAIAIALYNRSFDKNDFTYYADPGKIKNYLGAGVPVIMTDVPLIAKEVQKARCGFIVKYNKEELVRVITLYLSDKSKNRKYRENALYFAKRFDWEKVFTRAISFISFNEN